jgi:hypothetical protein
MLSVVAARRLFLRPVTESLLQGLRSIVKPPEGRSHRVVLALCLSERPLRGGSLRSGTFASQRHLTCLLDLRRSNTPLEVTDLLAGLRSRDEASGALDLVGGLGAYGRPHGPSDGR